MKKKIYALLIGLMLVAGCLSLAGCGNNTEEGEQVMGTFEAVDINNKPVTNEIFQDYKLTMINVWATFCNPCINEMPDLAKLNKEYKGEMQVVGIISDVYTAGSSTAMEIIKSTGADYIHIVNGGSLNDTFLDSVQAVPTTVFVNSKGNQVGETYTGSKSKEEWAEIIDELLKEIGE